MMVVCVVMTVAPAANAQVLERFALHGEIGGGEMLSVHQRNALHDEGTVSGGVQLGFRLFEPLSVIASYESWHFPGGPGQVHDVLGGLRLEPMLGTVGRLWLDASAGLARTGALSRVGLSIGLGFDFAVLPWLGIGPYVRYGHVFVESNDYPSDASYVAGGLAVTLSVPEERAPPPAPPSDRDLDGIIDSLDACPDQAHGEHPDPARHGCPLVDRDDDGVYDDDDQCPTEPTGARPDPARRGCPMPDSDGDGVLDADDACASTPAGPHPDPTRAGCPDPDTDADGLTDHADACPTQPPGLSPDPARPGCPAPDADGDSVPDATDACPQQAGAPSRDPHRNGCPGLVQVEGTQIRILRPVFFATARDTILRRSRPVLAAVADALLAEPQITRIAIEGYTDDVGDDAANMDLSQRRSASVVAWLVTAGVPTERLEAHGYGETRPLVPGTTRAARSANRRVEFHILTVQPVTSAR